MALSQLRVNMAENKLTKMAYMIWKYMFDTYNVDIDIEDIKEVIRDAL